MECFGWSERASKVHGIGPILSSPFIRRAARWKRAFLLDRGYSPPPRNITFILTNRCNLRCEMCATRPHLPLTDEYSPISSYDYKLNVDEWRHIVDQLVPFKPEIMLFGGEPLLENYCCELAAYIRGKGMACTITTNALLLEEKAEDIVKAGINTIYISIDGPRDIHDAVRGKVGTFDKALRGIKAVERLKKEKGLFSPDMHIICTINVTNQGSLHDLATVAQELPISTLIVQHPIFVTPGILGMYAADYERVFHEKPNIAITSNLYDVSAIDVEKLIQSIRGLKRMQGAVPISIRPELSDEETRLYYRSDTFRPEKRTTCFNPYHATTIFQGGEVSPCLIFIAGYLTREPFAAIWNNPRYRRFRRYFRKRILPFCTHCCALYYPMSERL